MIGHDVLVADDDEEVAATIADEVRARGDRPTVVHTVKDALDAIARIRFCYAIVDQQLPWDERSQAMTSGGVTVMEALRKQNSERVDKRWSALPIIAVTSFSDKPAFHDDVRDAGADAFVTKPIGQQLGEKIRILLDRAKKTSHDACGGPAPAAAASAPAVVRLAIDWTATSTRSAVIVNGVREEMQDRWFTVLLRLVAAHVRERGSWSTREELDIVRARDATTWVRAPFKPHVPPDFDVVEGDNRKRFRLNPAIVVERVDWAALERHPQPQIAQLAREMRGR